ncbi:MAG: M20 family metallopeptidase [Turicibacter sp.]|nr:M20 family metallopeptidase [Turicibacter sp.]
MSAEAFKSTFPVPDLYLALNTKKANPSHPLIREAIASRLKAYQELALDIHAHPEVSNYEFYSFEALAKQLEAEGFTVTRDVAGHRTGFSAVYDTKKPGPVMVFLAEYDALEGLGHGCGHNLYGVYSSLAAVALKNLPGLTGQVRVYGTPGEEGGENGSAKGSFVRHGFFDDVDAALCAHPATKYQPTSNSLAVDPVDIKFYGAASHAAAAPEHGINALEALISVFNGINALRLNLPKDVNIHGIITHGGDAPNVIPEFASARFFLRAANRKTLNKVYEKVENIVKGAALATGCTHEFGLFQNAVDDTIITPLFDDVFKSHFQSTGIPDTDIDLSAKNSFGSSDVGNVSQVIPTIQPTVSISDEFVPGHTVAFRDAAKSKKGLASIALTAELLAKTAWDLIENPGLLEAIKAQHKVQVEKGN